MFPFNIPLVLRCMGKTHFFPSSTEAFSITQWFQSLPPHLRFLAFSDEDSSSLTLRFAVETPQQPDWTSCRAQLALLAALRRCAQRGWLLALQVFQSLLSALFTQRQTQNGRGVWWQRLSMSSGSSGLRLRSSLAAGWTSGFSRGASWPTRQRSSPFFPEVHDKLTKSWRAPYSSRIRPSASSALTSVDGAEEKGYEHLPHLDESVAAHLCPPTAIGWKARASHPSKPCRARLPHWSQSPFHQRHCLLLGMVQRGVHFGNLWGSRLVLAIHICKVLQPGRPCLTDQSPFCLVCRLRLAKQSYGFTWPTLFKSLPHLGGPHYLDTKYQLYGTTPRPRMTLRAQHVLGVLYWLPWVFSHVSHGFESFPIIALCDCTGSHTASYDAVRVEYRKGTYSVTIITSVPWDMGTSTAFLAVLWAARLSRFIRRNQMRRRSGRLYSQRPRPFWQAA